MLGPRRYGPDGTQDASVELFPVRGISLPLIKTYASGGIVEARIIKGRILMNDELATELAKMIDLAARLMIEANSREVQYGTYYCVEKELRSARAALKKARG